MNEIINKFLLIGVRFMPNMHLKQPGFTYSTCGPFAENRERQNLWKKFMETGNTNFIYRNELDNACFQHDMAYGKSKDLTKRTKSNKVLKDKAFRIASNPNYDAYQKGLASMVYFLIKNLKQVVLLMNQIINWQMNFINQLLKHLKKEKFSHHLEIIFGVLI